MQFSEGKQSFMGVIIDLTKKSMFTFDFRVYLCTKNFPFVAEALYFLRVMYPSVVSCQFGYGNR